MRQVVHIQLVKTEYSRSHALQAKLHEMRCRGDLGDTIITVEHDPVFTLGRTGSRNNILVSEQERQQLEIPVYEIERGGDITYHGPGQLVCYPIIDLRAYGKDIKRYISSLEQAMIDLCADYAIEAARRIGYPGVWIEEHKIGSIGVSVRHWVTMHGLAFNINVNKDHFAMINPCGLPIRMISLADLTPESVTLNDVTQNLLRHMQSIFGWDIVPVDESMYWRLLDD
jgi:lipoate-protein ligase B